MLNDGRKVPPGTVIKGEVCIVGGGAAGVTAALELAGRGREVVLLEGGGLRAERAAQETYRGEIDGGAEVHPPLETLRQKQLGGTTTSWGGRCAPLLAHDLAAWPIGLSQLEPYYRRAHPYLELGEFEYSAGAALPEGGPFLVRPGQAARLTDDLIWRYSPPTKFGQAYRGRLKENPRLRVFHHANVVGLDLDRDGWRAAGAVAAAAPNRFFRVEAGAYVIAAGGLETTRLLLVTGRRAERRIGDDHLGRHYMTHVDGVVGRVGFPGPAPRAAYSYELSHDGVYCRRLVSLSEETRRQEGLLELGLVLTMPPARDPSHGDGLLSAFALTKEALARARLGFKSARYRRGSAPLAVPAHLRNILHDTPRLGSFALEWTQVRLLAARRLPSFLVEPRSGEYRLLFNSEQSPSPSNALELGSESDGFGVPRLRVRWRPAQSDYESAARSLSLVCEELRRLGLTAEAPSGPDELRSALGGGFAAGTHAMGTTRMSSSPQDGVVDADCRVHGLENLYVASSSVFPTGGFAAPTLTIVALAVRIGDTIDKRLGSPGTSKGAR